MARLRPFGHRPVPCTAVLLPIIATNGSQLSVFQALPAVEAKMSHGCITYKRWTQFRLELRKRYLLQSGHGNVDGRARSGVLFLTVVRVCVCAHACVCVCLDQAAALHMCFFMPAALNVLGHVLRWGNQGPSVYSEAQVLPEPRPSVPWEGLPLTLKTMVGFGGEGFGLAGGLGRCLDVHLIHCVCVRAAPGLGG